MAKGEQDKLDAETREAERREQERRENDQRVIRTREALVESFNGLVLDRTFDGVNVADVVADAGVGRSTFYEHFRNKDELLKQAAAGVMGVLADAVYDDQERARHAEAWSHWRSIEQVLDHVRANRAMARGLLTGESAQVMTRQLSTMIEARLAILCAERKTSLVIPARLAGAQLAGSVLGALAGWLDDVGSCGSAAAAAGIRRSVAAAARAMMVEGAGR